MGLSAEKMGWIWMNINNRQFSFNVVLQWFQMVFVDKRKIESPVTLERTRTIFVVLGFCQI